MINLVLENREVRERVEGLWVRDRVESDHQPVEVTIKRSSRKKGRREKGKAEGGGMGREKKEGVRGADGESGNRRKGFRRGEERDREEDTKSAGKGGKREGRREYKKGMVDKKCRMKKKKVRKELREW